MSDSPEKSDPKPAAPSGGAPSAGGGGGQGAPRPGGGGGGARPGPGRSGPGGGPGGPGARGGQGGNRGGQGGNRGGGPGGRGGGPGGGQGGNRGGGPGGRGGGRGGRGPGGRGRGRRDQDDNQPRLEERVIQINRVATTVKGGRRMSFSALVVVGDKKGQVGIGFGKAKEVPSAVEKAMKDARRKLTRVSLAGPTIPHEITGRFRASKMLLMPASSGTGVIAGASARAVLECVGVNDILTKNFGSTNPLNVAKATFEGLRELRSKETVEKLRGVSLA